MIFANCVHFSLCVHLQDSIYYSFDLIQFYSLQCGANVPMSFTCIASWSGSTHSRSTSSVRCAGKSGSSRSEDGDSSKDSSADSSADSASFVKDNSRTWRALVWRHSLPFVKKIYQEMDEKLGLFMTNWMFQLPSLTLVETWERQPYMKCIKSIRQKDFLDERLALLMATWVPGCS